MIRKPAAILFVLSLAVLALALVPAVGIAAKGGNGGKPGGGGGNTGTIALRMVEDANGNGSPNWNDTISFDVSPADSSELKLQCYKDGVSVYRTQTAYYEGYPFWWTQLMRLESGMWTGGAADCTAVLFSSGGRKTTTLATLLFHVDA